MLLSGQDDNWKVSIIYGSVEDVGDFCQKKFQESSRGEARLEREGEKPGSEEMETLSRQLFCGLALKEVEIWPHLEVRSQRSVCFVLLKMKDIQACLYELSEVDSIFIKCETTFCPTFKFFSILFSMTNFLVSDVDKK